MKPKKVGEQCSLEGDFLDLFCFICSDGIWVIFDHALECVMDNGASSGYSADAIVNRGNFQLTLMK